MELLEFILEVIGGLSTHEKVPKPIRIGLFIFILLFFGGLIYGFIAIAFAPQTEPPVRYFMLFLVLMIVVVLVKYLQELVAVAEKNDRRNQGK